MGTIGASLKLQEMQNSFGRVICWLYTRSRRSWWGARRQSIPQDPHCKDNPHVGNLSMRTRWLWPHHVATLISHGAAFSTGRSSHQTNALHTWSLRYACQDPLQAWTSIQSAIQRLPLSSVVICWAWYITFGRTICKISTQTTAARAKIQRPRWCAWYTTRSRIALMILKFRT